jgi:hypothetical protein
MPLREEYRLPPHSVALSNGNMTLKMRFREYSGATRALMGCFLEWDPEARCSARSALQYAYFKEEPRGQYSLFANLIEAQDPSLLPTFPEGRNMSENQYLQGWLF